MRDAVYTCESVVIRMARTPTRLWFDPIGARLFTLAPVTAVVSNPRAGRPSGHQIATALVTGA
jgi:hypothetical protein